jgi:TPR repeat protein
MKLPVLACVVLTLSTHASFAQATSARHITEKVGKRIESRNELTKEAMRSGAAPGEHTPPPAPAAPTPPPQPQATSTNKLQAIARPKAKGDKDSADKRLLDFQKQRAMSGQASAQYDLGMRYLNGDGVEENLEEGRKWIEKAAKQEHTMAIKKLEELDKKK